MGSFGGAFQAFSSAGYFILCSLGELFPNKDYDPQITNDPENELAREAYIGDHYWRLQYGFPVLCSIWMLLSFYCFIGTDSIMFNLSQGRESEAEILVKKVYRCEDQPSEEIVRVLKTQV